ncbi:MAG: LytTR family transcriptional regulator DNA-binding domain-containing protein [Prevotella sp.]|jgi:DNA-binding LytR/AlgR family response regulator|nr:MULTISPECIES: LytTR family DNA-binding domain-containing protein [unclassified Prevotella]MCH3969173.1 LytTR family transcriptional regulator DNA-binding domain-containing protein [Prevotella sp.]MCH3985804.1 LytTR family transcriptional regulator DNA-binding domain-containing protein [Prevotella sp.]MCH3991980.1 LytTR family transcriptional regulator DNA-binding domain-containing protein [Prevotella sp.]MCH4017450.1 LytTR family transcriptional regulator DNA-binding domain-containing protei
MEEQKKKGLIKEDRFFFVNSEYKTVQIKFDDILYIMGQKDYVKFFLKGNLKPVVCLMNMKRLDNFLPRPEFMRVHRSYIVHMPSIPMIDRFRIRFNETFIPISDTYKIAVQEYIELHSL